jgi:hypothetical protein
VTGRGQSLFRQGLTLAAGLLTAVWFFWGSPSARAQTDPGDIPVLPVARPNPYDRGTCYQWKGCLGESIGSMPVDRPEFCGPIGGKSWKDFDGKCHNLPQGPLKTEPPPWGGKNTS